MSTADDLVAARRFAVVSGILTAGFGVPLFLDPFRWAGWFRWPKERETNVGKYFGRCLGAVALGGTASAVQAARDPDRHRAHFRWLEAGSWLLAAVHVRGAVERSQPAIETGEIFGWAALALAARRYAPK